MPSVAWTLFDSESMCSIKLFPRILSTTGQRPMERQRGGDYGCPKTRMINVQRGEHSETDMSTRTRLGRP